MKDGEAINYHLRHYLLKSGENFQKDLTLAIFLGPVVQKCSFFSESIFDVTRGAPKECLCPRFRIRGLGLGEIGHTDVVHSSNEGF